MSRVAKSGWVRSHHDPLPNKKTGSKFNMCTKCFAPFGSSVCDSLERSEFSGLDVKLACIMQSRSRL